MVKNLKLLRQQYKLSQKQLGDVLGLSQQSINKYENHAVEPDIHTLITLAEYFHTSVDYLIGHTDIPHIIEQVKQYELNDDEATLMDKYRKLNATEKDSIHFVMNNYIAKSPR